ncbi:MAG: serine--tRNA ligase [Planctomycetota bacterium]
MIDIKDLRQNPDKYRKGAADKCMDVDIDRLLTVDAQLREGLAEKEQIQAERNRIGKEVGQLMGRLKKAGDAEKPALEAEVQALQARPGELKEREKQLSERVTALQEERDQLWIELPQPPDHDVPVGKSAADNTEIRRWNPDWFDPGKSFSDNKGFTPKGHIELGLALGMFDFERGVKMAGSRSYVLTGAGMMLHQAVLRYAFDFMVKENGFRPMSVPVIVREECMLGTAFFPHGRDQAYMVNERARGEGQDSYLTGTGEVGLMGYHQGEILNHADLPLSYTTVSTCFRREAGAAGRDTAGLYRIHQFDKVEQVVICESNEELSRDWHKKMMGFVEQLLQNLGLPYRLLQCCTGDLGPKNADMIDIETWMPSRGALDENEQPQGEYGETHSASRLYDYQCRRLNIRYKDPETKKTRFCHSLNNTVAASPRLLIPIMELYQNDDGSITVPEVLRDHMCGMERITAQ